MQLSYNAIMSSSLVAFLSFAVSVSHFEGWLSNNFSFWDCLSCLIQAFSVYMLSELVKFFSESLSTLKA